MHELVRRIITVMIKDVLDEAQRRIAAKNIRTVDDVRRAGETLVALLAGAGARAKLALKRFLTENVYRNETRHAAGDARRGADRRSLRGVLRGSVADAGRMGRRSRSAATPSSTARRVADYIAGMTDRYAIAEHQRLFDDTPDLG